MSYKDNRAPVLISSNYLAYCLTGATDANKWLCRCLKAGLDELVEMGLLHQIHQYGKTGAAIYDIAGSVPKEKSFFTLVERDEVQCIFAYEDGGSAFALLRVFCVLVSTMAKNKKTGVYTGTTTIEYQQSIIGMSANTYIRYLRILENELGLLYIYRPRTFYYNDKAGAYNGIANTYGRMKDKQAIEAAGQEHVAQLREANNQARKQTEKANPKRWAAMIFYHWNKGKEYPASTLKKAYDLLYRMNEDYSGDCLRSKRIRDLSAFAKYDFYHGNGSEGKTTAMNV